MHSRPFMIIKPIEHPNIYMDNNNNRVGDGTRINDATIMAILDEHKQHIDDLKTAIDKMLLRIGGDAQKKISTENDDKIIPICDEIQHIVENAKLEKYCK